MDSYAKASEKRDRPQKFTNKNAIAIYSQQMTPLRASQSVSKAMRDVVNTSRESVKKDAMNTDLTHHLGQS